MVGCESRHHRDCQEPGGEAQQREPGQECPRQDQVATGFIHKTGIKVVFDYTFSMPIEDQVYFTNLSAYPLRSNWIQILEVSSDTGLESGT